MSMHYCSPLGKIRTAVIICCFVLILGIFGYAYLLGSNNSVIPKDEIITNLDTVGEEELDYEYTSSYLKKYGIGNINTYKFNAVEQQLVTDDQRILVGRAHLAYIRQGKRLEHKRFLDSRCFCCRRRLFFLPAADKVREALHRVLGETEFMFHTFPH